LLQPFSFYEYCSSEISEPLGPSPLFTYRTQKIKMNIFFPIRIGSKPQLAIASSLFGGNPFDGEI
jgi:hypothetical protein